MDVSTCEKKKFSHNKTGIFFCPCFTDLNTVVKSSPKIMRDTGVELVAGVFQRLPAALVLQTLLDLLQRSVA